MCASLMIEVYLLEEKMEKCRHACVKDASMVTVAASLRILSETHRLRIICILLKSDKCVNELSGELGISQPLTSHHLGVLKEERFVNSTRSGSTIYYSANMDTLTWLSRALSTHVFPWLTLADPGRILTDM